MQNIYDALLRVENLYGCTTAQEMADLLEIPLMTFYDNKRKAIKEHELIKEINIEDDKNKKKQLEKELEKFKKKIYTNSLYASLINLAQRDNLNLNWIFYDKLPIHTNNKKIAKIVQKQNIKNSISDNQIAIPYYSDIKASAGNGYINSEDEEPKYIVLPKEMIKGKKLNAIRVEGDSMTPSIKPNSIILIDLDKTTLKSKFVFVVRYEDEVYVKRLEDLGDKILLKSDNIAYNSIVLAKEDIQIIGQVVHTVLNNNIE